MNVTFRFCWFTPSNSLKLPVFKGVFTDLGSHSFLHISFYPLYSLGVTDEIWWNFIGANVFSKNKRIIYCPHEKGDNAPLNATDLIRKNHKFKTELAARLSGDNSEQQTLYNKIYPIRNNHLFNFGNNSAYRIRVRNEVISTLLSNK